MQNEMSDDGECACCKVQIDFAPGGTGERYYLGGSHVQGQVTELEICTNCREQFEQDCTLEISADTLEPEAWATLLGWIANNREPDPQPEPGAESADALARHLREIADRTLRFMKRNQEDSGRDDPLEVIEKAHLSAVEGIQALKNFIDFLKSDGQRQAKIMEEVASNLRAIHKQI